MIGKFPLMVGTTTEDWICIHITVTEWMAALENPSPWTIDEEHCASEKTKNLTFARHSVDYVDPVSGTAIGNNKKPSLVEKMENLETASKGIDTRKHYTNLAK